MKPTKLHFVLASLVVGGASTAALATTFNAEATHDCMIFATSGGSDTGNASGKGPGMFAGADGNGDIKRGLVEFDLSSIPSTSTLTEVDLNLTLGMVAGTGHGTGFPYTPTISLFTVTTSWNEGNTGATACGGGLCSSMSGTGQGWSYSTCNCNDTSWNYTDYNTTSWTSAGGDYTATADAALTISTFTIGETNTWTGTSMTNSNMLTAVQHWVSGTSANYGFEIKSNLEGSLTSFLGWWTRDGAIANSEQNVWTPELTVKY